MLSTLRAVTTRPGTRKTSFIQVPTEWNPEKFLSGTTNALKAHPEANCIFVASDFCFSAVETALRNAGRYYPAGDPRHVYIDVATTYDAYYHAVALVKAAVALATGRPATPANVEKLDNMWARDYKD
jgi:ABC-type sugar transport system substrate-binding protein